MGTREVAAVYSYSLCCDTKWRVFFRFVMSWSFLDVHWPSSDQLDRFPIFLCEMTGHMIILWQRRVHRPSSSHLVVKWPVINLSQNLSRNSYQVNHEGRKMSTSLLHESKWWQWKLLLMIIMKEYMDELIICVFIIYY